MPIPSNIKIALVAGAGAGLGAGLASSLVTSLYDGMLGDFSGGEIFIAQLIIAGLATFVGVIAGLMAEP